MVRAFTRGKKSHGKKGNKSDSGRHGRLTYNKPSLPAQEPTPSRKAAIHFESEAPMTKLSFIRPYIFNISIPETKYPAL
jgi:hypothetical protein